MVAQNHSKQLYLDQMMEKNDPCNNSIKFPLSVYRGVSKYDGNSLVAFRQDCHVRQHSHEKTCNIIKVETINASRCSRVHPFSFHLLISQLSFPL